MPLDVKIAEAGVMSRPQFAAAHQHRTKVGGELSLIDAQRGVAAYEVRGVD